MKIVLTGGGSGGHFYPIVAVAQSLHEIIKRERLVGVEIFFISDAPYDERALFENGVEFKQAYAGKMRRYFSILNVFDIFLTIIGVLKAIVQLFKIFPNVVFAKGGYASFPTLFAAKILHIPVVIHESDSVPGRLNKWAGKFATRIAVSYPEAAKYFPKEKVAYTGNPLRKDILKPATEGAFEFFNLEKDVPTIFILGGSHGAEIINDNITDVLPELLEKYQIIHQTGKRNIVTAKGKAELILEKNLKANRYHPIAFLDDLNMKMAAGAANLIISRAGSTIFEIASWGKPSIVIPITDTNGDHQRGNAYLYARSGSAVVVEEGNLTPHLLLGEINRLFESPERMQRMSESALKFARVDAADKIAEVIMEIALEKENS